MEALRPSYFFIITWNRGKAVRMMTTTAIASRGMETASTVIRAGCKFRAITRAITNMMGERTAMRTSIITTDCTWFTSVVRRVTREAVENLSMFLKEKCCTFSNSAWRRFRPKPRAPLLLR